VNPLKGSAYYIRRESDLWLELYERPLSRLGWPVVPPVLFGPVAVVLAGLVPSWLSVSLTGLAVRAAAGLIGDRSIFS